VIPDAKIDQIRRSNCVVEVIRGYLPLKQEGNEFVACCPFHTEKTGSFKANIEKQVWKCFGCDLQGDVIEFVKRFERTDFIGALKILAKRAAIVLDENQSRTVSQDSERKFYRPQPTATKPPPLPDKTLYTPIKEGSRAWKYLTEERKLFPETLEMYRLHETVSGDAIAFPFCDVIPARDETMPAKLRTVLYKVLKIERPIENGKPKKIMWKDPAGAEWMLFGKQCIAPSNGTLTITEGEIDAMTMTQYGFQAVSVPNGASSMQWIDREFDWLARFERIHLVFDMDDAGQKHVMEILKRLGEERCDIVSMKFGEVEA
jgi:DNA primase